MLNQKSTIHICQTTAATDESGPVPTVQVAPNDVQTFDKVPNVQTFGFGSCPPVGTLVMHFSPNGDTTNGVIVGSVNQASRPKTLTPGQSVQYDAYGSTILLDNAGNITVNPKGGNVTVNGPAIVNGATKINGTLTVSGDVIAGSTMISLINHTHSGVQTGTGVTGKPLP